MATMIAHEVLSHAYENDLGITERSTDPDTGIPNHELNAMQIENEFNSDNGRPLADSYDGKSLKSKKKKTSQQKQNNNDWGIDEDRIYGSRSCGRIEREGGC